MKGGEHSGAARSVEEALAVAAGFLLLQLLVGSVQRLLTTRLAGELARVLRHRVMAAVLAPTGIGHLEDPETLDRVNEAAAAATAGIGPETAVFTMSGVLGSYLTGTAMLIGVASFTWLGALALFVAWVLYRSRRRRENLELYAVMLGQTSENRRGEYFRRLALTSAAAKEIQVFGLGSWLTGQFQQHWLNAMGPLWRARRDRRAPLALLLGLIVVLHVLIFVALVRSAQSGHIGIATVALVVQGMFGAAVLGSGDGIEDVLFYLAAATIPASSKLESWLDVQPHGATLAVEHDEGLQTGTSTWHGLCLEGIRFRYPGQDLDTLRGVDLVLPAGRSVAVVGHNGAGKTTLIKLICRLTEPDEGRLLFGDLDAGRVDARLWRRHLAVVFQDFVHYPASAGTTSASERSELALPRRHCARWPRWPG